MILNLASSEIRRSTRRILSNQNKAIFSSTNQGQGQDRQAVNIVICNSKFPAF